MLLRKGADDLDELRNIVFPTQMHQHRAELFEQALLVLSRDGLHHLFLRGEVEVERADDHPGALSDIGKARLLPVH